MAKEAEGGCRVRYYRSLAVDLAVRGGRLGQEGLFSAALGWSEGGLGEGQGRACPIGHCLCTPQQVILRGGMFLRVVGPCEVAILPPMPWFIVVIGAILWKVLFLGNYTYNIQVSIAECILCVSLQPCSSSPTLVTLGHISKWARKWPVPKQA